MIVQVALQRLDLGLPVPAAAQAGDAGVDLYARASTFIRAGGGRALVPTGVAVAIPRDLGLAALLLPRSGLALHHGVTILNSPGLIDSGYRGELKALLVNTDPHMHYEVMRGDRIAQLVLLPVMNVAFAEVAELDDSERGDGGFGSSGV